MTVVIDKRKLREMMLTSDIELLIHAFMHAEIQQFQRVSDGLPRDVSYVTLRSALAEDVIARVKKHIYDPGL